MRSPDFHVDVLRTLRKLPELLTLVEESNASELKLQTQLRESYPAEVVRAAMSLVELRKKACDKFTLADQMWFDRTGLEQSTPEQVAQHKAQRFHGLNAPVADLCCGIGSDAIALARAGCQVTAVDQSEAACLRTQWNAEIHHVGDRVQTLRSAAEELGQRFEYVHCDPDRRATGKRSVRLEDYQPSLEFLQELMATASGGALKLSPASNFGGKFDGAEIELVSLYGECKEATVWFGQLETGFPWRATLLPSGFTFAAEPLDHFPRVGPLGEFLYDVDPAIVRAGLVDAIADELELDRLDDAEEYFTSQNLVISPAVTPFRVLAELSHNRKEIRKYFRDNSCHELEIKCRHVPVDVEALRKSLTLSGTGRKTLFIAKLAGKTRVVITERVADSHEIYQAAEK